MTALAELLERVEKAEGPSMDLDTAILQHLGFTWRGMNYWSADNKTMWTGPVRFTSSVDAALALAQRKFPGRRMCMERGENYISARFVKGWGGRRETGPVSERPDDELALVICAAILTALLAKAAP